MGFIGGKVKCFCFFAARLHYCHFGLISNIDLQKSISGQYLRGKVHCRDKKWRMLEHVMPPHGHVFKHMRGLISFERRLTMNISGKRIFRIFGCSGIEFDWEIREKYCIEQSIDPYEALLINPNGAQPNESKNDNQWYETSTN